MLRSMIDHPLLLTPGEPAGIGPDIVIKMAQEGFGSQTIVLADPALLAQRAEQLGLALNIRTITSLVQKNQPTAPKEITVLPIRMPKAVKPGQPEVVNASYVLECLQTASDICLQTPGAALVTGPVHKAIINDAGFSFAGHTQFLARLAQKEEEVVMFFVSPLLRLALVTDHLPLHQVSQHITKIRLKTVVKCLHDALQKRFKLTSPRLYLCGLNPHAGEEGYLGTEEQQVIAPALDELREQGFQVFGPGSADTAFCETSRRQYDAIIAMYHDQGLPAFKQLAFGQSVNITLGLPYLRTSVDHGTALSLAGTGKADDSSLRYVMATTRELMYAAIA